MSGADLSGAALQEAESQSPLTGQVHSDAITA